MLLKFFFKHIIVIVVDESNHVTSGCSKDQCFRVFKEAKKKYNLDFFRRDLVYYNYNNTFFVKSINEFKNLDIDIKNKSSLINIMVKTKKDIGDNFEHNYKDSIWAKIHH